jgi:hypothetical protein
MEILKVTKDQKALIKIKNSNNSNTAAIPPEIIV